MELENVIFDGKTNNISLNEHFQYSYSYCNTLSHLFSIKNLFGLKSKHCKVSEFAFKVCQKLMSYRYGATAYCLISQTGLVGD